MARHLHNQRDVYDDETDTWYRCETLEEAIAFCQETGGSDHGVPTENAPAKTLSGWNAPVAVATTPYKLISSDPARIQLRVNYLGAGVLLIGQKNAVLAGQGYGIQGGQSVQIESQEELWVNLVGTGAGQVYCLSEGVSQ